MHPLEGNRIASSHLMGALFGDVQKYASLLRTEGLRLSSFYPDETLDPLFRAVDSRVINICPMVLCDALLADLGMVCPDSLLTGLGLAMFSISTHDDLVDEFPRDRPTAAGLVYAGNIATLQGLRLLIESGHGAIVPNIVANINKNHYHQARIARTLWQGPTDEVGYLAAIQHTGYWIGIGLNAALAYGSREDLQDTIGEFAMNYGMACQIGDDMREIPDDQRNGYWSLPLIIAKESGLDLSKPAHLNAVIARPLELAQEYLERAQAACFNAFPRLLGLTLRLAATGRAIRY